MQDRKNDLRVVKTAQMLNTAMFSLLKRQTFRKTTVRDICDEAQISRATFYARYADKYDFLKNWLINLAPDGLENNTSEKIREIHNDNFYKNKAIVKNLIIDSDNETLGILAEFILTYYIQSDKDNLSPATAEQIVLSSFFAGGMLFYIMWQVENRFPADVAFMNTYLHELIKKFRDWESDT